LPEYDLYNEKELLLLVARGDERAFTALYNHYQPLLVTHLYRITQSETQAAEYTQDVFLKIWQNRVLLEGITHFKAYLSVVSRNYAINALKRLATAHKHYQRWVQEAGPEAQEAAPETPDLWTLLDQAIEQLPQQQKKVYLLARQQRLSYAAVAAELGLSAGTVKRYLQIATENITRYLLSHAASESLKIMLALFIWEQL